MTEHDFNESLRFSHRQSDEWWWELVYRAAFPDFDHMIDLRADMKAQRLGVDRVVVTKSEKRLRVDEKVRRTVWPDILLEYWSKEPTSDNRGVLGWVAKDLHTDFIAYAFVPSQTCYLLPFQTLRVAWKRNGRKWVDRHKIVRAQNVDKATGHEWTTTSVAVPVEELLNSLADASVLRWGIL